MEYRHKRECGVVVEEVTRENEVAGLNPTSHVAREKWHDLRLGTGTDGQ